MITLLAKRTPVAHLQCLEFPVSVWRSFMCPHSIIPRMSWSQKPGVCSLLTRDNYPCTDAFWPRHAVEAMMWGAARVNSESDGASDVFLNNYIQYFTSRSKSFKPRSAIVVLYWAHRQIGISAFQSTSRSLCACYISWARVAVKKCTAYCWGGEGETLGVSVCNNLQYAVHWLFRFPAPISGFH